MFYAPWCGHCKRLKPDYQAAAKELRGSATLAAMDVNKPENSPVMTEPLTLSSTMSFSRQVARKFNVTGFPTLLYFNEGQYQYAYPGKRLSLNHGLQLGQQLVQEIRIFG